MKIKLSVRHLVEFIFRGGDISDSSSGTLSAEAMLAGSRMHRKLQRRAGTNYHAEVPLKLAVRCGNHDIDIEGRADGIIDAQFEQRETRKVTQESREDNDGGLERNMPGKSSGELQDGVSGECDGESACSMTEGFQMSDTEPPAGEAVVDEIKGVYRKLEDMKAPVKVHVAQAMCYAYMYAREFDIDEIDIRMSYVNIDSEEEKFFIKTYSYSFLSKWFDDAITELAKWLDFVEEHRQKRDGSICDLEFPYEYRKGQKEMAFYVYKAIEQGLHLYVQAPTGIGKTLAAIYPAIKEFPSGRVQRIFYLTAKTVAHTAPKGTMELLTDRGLEFVTVILTAKEKICAMEEMECNPEICPRAKGHFDRVNDALYDLVTHEDMIDRDTVALYAEKHSVCPFELSLDATWFADAVICDYNYVFDPRVCLKRFFSDEAGLADGNVFLVDEAHNLVERASAMYSASLVKEDFLTIRRLASKYSSRLSSHLYKCNSELVSLKKELPDSRYGVLHGIGELEERLLSLHFAMNLFLSENRKFPERKQVLDFYFRLTAFLDVAEIRDENYVTYDELQSDGSFMVKQYCVRPAVNICKRLDKGVATVLFSATILPIKYYKRMLTDSRKDMAIYIRSPFDEANRRILVANDVTTRYTRRNNSQYSSIYQYVRSAVTAHRGNYMVFLPSYAMLEQISAYAYAEEGELDVRVVTQKQNMTEADREGFLAQFSDHQNILAFCIMGGIFSEGIDLTGERLVGAVVVGPGLPQVCTERQILRDYFDSKALPGGGKDSSYSYASDMDGFKYAYQYPGINKVFQAAGRVIRTETDCGVILLLDDRFVERRYSDLFPVEWNDYIVCNRENVDSLLAEFWNSK